MDYKKLLLNMVEQAEMDTEESRERLEIAYYFTRRLLQGF